MQMLTATVTPQSKPKLKRREGSAFCGMNGAGLHAPIDAHVPDRQRQSARGIEGQILDGEHVMDKTGVPANRLHFVSEPSSAALAHQPDITAISECALGEQVRCTGTTLDLLVV